jgi:hypothetical protein
MEFVKELLGIDMTTFGLTVKMGWMVLWPVIIVECMVHWRCIKSFGRSK